MHQYIEKAEDIPSEAMLSGSAVHSALETWMAEEGEDIGDLMDIFTASLNVARKTAPISNEEEEAARVMLMDYYDKLSSVNKDLVLGVEEDFVLDLPACQIRGVIDRVEYLDDKKDTIVVIDYKSGRYAISQNKMKENAQLAIYTKYAQQTWPADKYIAELHYPRLDKILRYSYSQEEVDHLVEDVENTALDIKYDDDFWPKGSPFTCGTCGYVEDCGWGRVQYKIYAAIKRKSGETVPALKPR
jgi:putative RecB family exonuclease